MDLFLLILGFLFMVLGFVVPFVVDCGIGSIGLFVFGLIGLYLFVTNILCCFGASGKALHDSIDNVVKRIFSVLFDSDFVGYVYYDISIFGHILLGGFFSLFTLGLGWLAFSMFKSAQITPGLMVTILFFASFAAGPNLLYKGIKELYGRVKQSRREKEDANDTEAP